MRIRELHCTPRTWEGKVVKNSRVDTFYSQAIIMLSSHHRGGVRDAKKQVRMRRRRAQEVQDPAETVETAATGRVSSAPPFPCRSAALIQSAYDATLAYTPCMLRMVGDLGAPSPSNSCLWRMDVAGRDSRDAGILATKLAEGYDAHGHSDGAVDGYAGEWAPRVTLQSPTNGNAFFRTPIIEGRCEI